MLYKKIISIFLIFICSFQLAFGETISRYPAGYGHEIEMEDLIEEMQKFRVDIWGKEIPGKGCVKEEEGEKKEEAKKEEDKEEKKEEGKEEECVKVKKIKGFIDTLVERVILEEKEMDEEGDDDALPKAFRVDDPEVRRFHKKAEYLRDEVRKYLGDGDYKKEERQKLLITYLDQVVMTVRDLMIVRRAYVPKEYSGNYFYNSLLVQFPTSLFPKDNLELRDKISMGPNPSVNPFYLEIIDRSFGRSNFRFKELEAMSRDVITLMKAPTKRNYLRATKWLTLHLMMSQLYMYNTMLGNKGEIRIPRTCQNHFNGNLPRTLKMTVKDGDGEKMMDSILANNGLIFSMKNFMFMEYYLENIKKDPTRSGYSGLMPFEQYKNAKVYKNRDSRSCYVPGGRSTNPTLDDITHYDSAVGIRLNDAMEAYEEGEDENDKMVYFDDKKLLEEIIKTPPRGERLEFEIKKEGEEPRKVTIDPARQNLSIYLAKVLQEKAAAHFEDIISDQLKKKLKDSKLRIQIPSLYGAAVWRRWALKLLSKIAYEYQGKNDAKVNAAFVKACERMTVNAPGGISSTATQYRTRTRPVAHSAYGRNHNPYFVPTEKQLELCATENEQFSKTNRRVSGGGYGYITRYRMKKADKIMEGVANFLEEFRYEHNFTPLRRFYAADYQQMYPALSVLWDVLRDSTDALPEAKPSEYAFLISQMKTYNPWARLRLGYLIAMEDYQSVRDNFKPTYVKGFLGLWKSQSKKTSTFYDDIDDKIDRLKEAAREFKIDRPLYPAHAEKILKQAEKQYLWNNVIDSTHENNMWIFGEKIANRESYDYIEDISYETLLTRDDVEKAIKDHAPRRRINPRRQNEIDKLLESDQGKTGKFFLELYKLRGDVEKQKEYFTKFSKENGINNTYMAKMGFLSLDNDIKRSIYKDIMVQALIYRKNKVKSQLSDFCSLEPNDYKGFQALFFSTMKAQNRLHQMVGLPTVTDKLLEKVRDKATSMSDEEWGDIWWGLGSGGLAMLALMIGAVCTGVTGGLCAPLAVVMVGAAYGAIAMQTNLMFREMDRKVEADMYEDRVQGMEDLGFTTEGSAYEVSRSWFWTIFEGICIIPLIGIVGRSTNVVLKIGKVTGKAMLGKLGKIGYKEAVKRVFLEADVKYARYVLGFESLLKDMGLEGAEAVGKEVASEASEAAVKEARRGAKSLFRRFMGGEIGIRGFTEGIAKIMKTKPAREAAENIGRVVVKESVEEIDKRAAQVVARYFGGNAREMLNIMGSYGKRLDKAIKTMAKIEAKETIAGKIPIAGRLINWIRGLRFGHLAKHADKIKSIQEQLEILIKSGGSLDDLILKNMDDLTDIFIKIPMRKRELLYMVLLQGGPHVGGAWFGRRIPGLYQLADGLILRKIFNARARLVLESIKAKARAALGLSKYVAAETTFHAFQAFQKSVIKASEEAGTEGGQQIMKQYNALQDDIAVKLYEHVVKAKLGQGGSKFKMKDIDQIIDLGDINVLKRIIFNPDNVKEKAIGQVIWSAMPVDDIFGMKEVSEMAHRIVKELKFYKDADQFDTFLNALKILIINREPGVVEIM